MSIITRFFLPFAVLLLACAHTLAVADEWQNLNTLKKLAEAYARSETSQYPGKVGISLGKIDERLRLPACAAPEAFTPAGARLWGNSTLGIRCANPGWSISVPVRISVQGEVVTAARPLARNRVIEAVDLAPQQVELTQLPAGTLTDATQIVGQQLLISIPAGASFKAGMLRAPYLVLQGQKVKLITQGADFSVSGDGKAMTNGSLGQSISVRAASGKMVSGKVKAAGVVEVIY